MAEKTRYTDAELEEFRAIIMEKLELAQRDYDRLKNSIMNKDGNDVDDTSPTYKVLEEGANTLSKEETTRLAARQLKFIQNLQAALVRIENKTYGICRETGKLSKEEQSNKPKWCICTIQTSCHPERSEESEYIKKRLQILRYDQNDTFVDITNTY